MIESSTVEHDEVRLFRIELASDAGDPALLSDEERARAAKFANPRLRDYFVAAHAGLRRILGRELGRAPESLRLVEPPGAKPRLDDDALQFNLAHSGDVALVAVARTLALGIDLEEVRSESEYDLPDLTTQICTAAEQGRLARLAPDERLRALLEIWTRKEAYLKWSGEGLAREPRELELDALPVRFHALDIGPRYVATLAVADEAQPRLVYSPFSSGP
jgi:4'-phosphopantetheinyl transferase